MRPTRLFCCVLIGLLLPAPLRAQPASAPRTFMAAGAEAEALIRRLGGTDPADCRIAAVRLKNLAGEEYEAVRKASERADLSPEAKAAIQDALPPLKARARSAARLARDHRDNLRTALEAYEKFGKKDAKWDAAAREGIRLFVLPGRDTEKAAATLKQAVDAGCDDPFIRYLYARARINLVSPGDREGVLDDHRIAAVDLAKTNYPAGRKLSAAGYYVSTSGRPDAEMAAICMRALPETVADRERLPSHVHEQVVLAFEALAKAKNRTQAFEDVFAIYGKGRPKDDPWPHYFKGDFYIDAAWEARGNGLAHTVTPEGWALFNERLAIAGSALEKAWELGPEEPEAPARMITVILGTTGDREEMEKWFARAMAANPNSYGTCQAKLNFLLPRWHGSEAEMIEFGRECIATQNWWGELPLIIVDVYREIVNCGTHDPKELYTSPEVWRDIHSAYASFLEVYPDSDWAPRYRNRLAKLACRSEQWAEAAQQFEAIGQNFDDRVFRSKAVFDYWRQKANRKAAGPVAPAEQVRAGWEPRMKAQG